MSRTVYPFFNLPPAVSAIGNTYYVIQTTEAFYGQFVNDHSVTYSDGSNSICPHTSTSALVTTNGIKAALAKTVASRNDYVIVLPSSTTYYIDEPIAMDKMRVHLICLEGINDNAGVPGNWARIQQITAANAAMTISAGTVEVAGLMLKGYVGVNVVNVTGSLACVSFHDNFVSLKTTGTHTQYGILVSGATCQNFNIYNNWIGIYEPDATAHITALLAFTGADQLRHVIRNNSFHSGAHTTSIQTIDVGLDLSGSGAYESEVIGNRFCESVLGTQVMTYPMSDSGYNFYADNRVFYHGTVGNSIHGAAADQGGVQNYVSIDGGRESTGLILYA
jgi:hypothetical protein